MKRKHVLVTAGNTSVPIDKVRCISNIFKGRTGADIAYRFALAGCDVTLLTSHPDRFRAPSGNITILDYRYYDELMAMMRDQVTENRFDVVVHSAAVSDYMPDGTFRETDSTAAGNKIAAVLERLDGSGKIGSNHERLWMRMVPTEKIIDKIRTDWGFTGMLVKFKLQVNMSDEELIKIATASMTASRANLIVANTLEGMTHKAFIISERGGEPLQVTRETLPTELMKAVFS